MSYTQLNLRERMSLFYLHQAGFSLREIGRRLNRSHTTISRELRRNKRILGCYCDRAAQSFTEERKAIPRHFRKQSNEHLYHYVVEKLELGWSPEVISKRLTREKKTMRVSHETVYQWIYKDVQQGGTLFTNLVRCHKKRKKQRRYGSLRGLIGNPPEK